MTAPGKARPADRVLLLHGILRSAASMSRLDLALVAEGYRRPCCTDPRVAPC